MNKDQMYAALMQPADSPAFQQAMDQLAEQAAFISAWEAGEG
jgi:hypothetical protein